MLTPCFNKTLLSDEIDQWAVKLPVNFEII